MNYCFGHFNRKLGGMNTMSRIGPEVNPHRIEDERLEMEQERILQRLRHPVQDPPPSDELKRLLVAFSDK